MPLAPLATPATDSPWVVVDTNVWLDLLLFNDLRAQPLWPAPQGRRPPALAAPTTLDAHGALFTPAFHPGRPVPPRGGGGPGHRPGGLL